MKEEIFWDFWKRTQFDDLEEFEYNQKWYANSGHELSHQNRKVLFEMFLCYGNVDIAQYLYQLGLGSEYEINRVMAENIKYLTHKVPLVSWVCSINMFALIVNFYRISVAILDSLDFSQETLIVLKDLRSNKLLPTDNFTIGVNPIIIHILMYHNKINIVELIKDKLPQITYSLSKKKRITTYRIEGIDVNFDKAHGNYGIDVNTHCSKN